MELLPGDSTPSPGRLARDRSTTRTGFRGRFGVDLQPLLEALGLAELEHNPKHNRMRAK